MGKIVLKSKIKVNDKDVKVLNLKLIDLKVMDLVSAERDYHLNGGTPTAPLSLNFSYCLCVAAKASGYEYGDLVELSALDGCEVVEEVQRFLLGMEQTHKKLEN